ncbi:MAG: alpha-hydroxy-acid oxidizing protein [Lachnospiraceae bacterium]|nr:alpha-hydroxy-acid oxidizing protein [Lachnospiraceae bacterium]
MGYEKKGYSSLFTRDYFDSLLVETRYIDSGEADTSFAVYGKKFTSPVMVAISDSEGVHKAETVETAGAAGKAGIICWVDTKEKEKLSEITDTGVLAIKIIRPYADNKLVISQIEQAQECGVLAVGIDISLALDDRTGDNTAFKSMEEIQEFASAASVPFIVKGILSERDAYKCLRAGASGIVMSVHNSLSGYAISPFVSLPGILNAVNAQIPVFVDCEIANGLDAFKALALGSSAVFIKQTFTTPPKENRVKSVFDKISSVNDELKNFMSKTGCHNLSYMDKTVLWQI